MTSHFPQIVKRLMDKGVHFTHPHSVEIGPEIDPERISSEGIVIHAGCRLRGSQTQVLTGAQLGYEAPVTVEDCHIGPQVRLKGGFFKQAVFLKGASMGSGAHVREGCILEEQASGAHTVGLKHTILFPFVTLGSLINFCDCLMSGGTSRRNHSEVGSSYIHFNYTPNQDKATPSLVGNVPHGVMLNQAPIFLGGQGGLAGPCRLEHGTVVAAGAICRKDVLQPGRLIIEGRTRGGSLVHVPGLYRSVGRIFINNLIYIANLISLMEWYRHVRSCFVGSELPPTLLKASTDSLNAAIDERMGRLGAFCQKLPRSLEIYREHAKAKADVRLVRQKQELFHQWHLVEDIVCRLRAQAPAKTARDIFLKRLERHRTNGQVRGYLSAIQSLQPADADLGSQWMQAIVDQVLIRVCERLPLLRAATSTGLGTGAIPNANVQGNE